MADIILTGDVSGTFVGTKSADIAIDDSSGNNTINLGAGDDLLKYYVTANLDSVNQYNGGSGVDTLMLMIDIDQLNAINSTTMLSDFNSRASSSFDFSKYDAQLGFHLDIHSVNFENLVFNIQGTEGDDVIIGTAGHDIIYGLGGNDVIIGENFADVSTGLGDAIYGGDGNDAIIATLFSTNNHIDGGSGNDRILGSAGDDVILGGDGNDIIAALGGINTMTGGAGADTFFFSIADENGAVTTITDFSVDDQILITDDFSEISVTEGSYIDNVLTLSVANTNGSTEVIILNNITSYPNLAQPDPNHIIITL